MVRIGMEYLTVKGVWKAMLTNLLILFITTVAVVLIFIVSAVIILGVPVVLVWLTCSIAATSSEVKK